MDTRRIVVVGVGGAGGHLIDVLYGGMEEQPSLVAVNTDAKALADGRATTKIQIGSDCTRGLGAGGDPEIGRKAALEDLELLRGLFTDAVLVIVLAGLGGGTGSGAAPVVIETAKKAGALAMAFVTLPFDFEGRGRIKVADDALGELRNAADSTFVVPNERLFKFVDMQKLTEAFAGADDVLEKGINAIWRMLVMPAYISVDIADLQKIAEPTGGTATFAYGEGTGEDRGAVAAGALLNSPMLAGKTLENTDAILVSLTGGADMALSEIGHVMDRIKSVVSPEANIMVGTVVDESWNERLSVSVFVSEEWVEGQREIESSVDVSDSALKMNQSLKQAMIEFVPGKGRFKDVEPTVMNGEDLDVPTFVRRGIQLTRIVS